MILFATEGLKCKLLSETHQAYKRYQLAFRMSDTAII